MKDWGIPIPIALLIHPHLTAFAKLVWMLHAARHLTRTREIDPNRVSGLSRPTVSAAVCQLEQANWAIPGDAASARRAAASPGLVSGGGVATTRRAAGVHGVAGVHGATLTRGVAILPVHLLIDSRLPAQAKVLFGVLQALPGFNQHIHGGQFTYCALRELTGAGVNTLKAAAGELVRMEWLHISQGNRLKPITFRLLNPLGARAELWIELARVRIEGSQNRPETIMRELLTLLIESEDFEDDAEPGYLVNPMTQTLMQFDRFYPPNTAFEYNGPHHYGPTSYCSLEESLAQQGRDLMKTGWCARRGVRLEVIHRSDLSLIGMREKLQGLGLPMRDLTGIEPGAAPSGFV